MHIITAVDVISETIKIVLHAHYRYHLKYQLKHLTLFYHVKTMKFVLLYIYHYYLYSE